MRAVASSLSTCAMYWQVQNRLARHCLTNATMARSSASAKALCRPQLLYAVFGKPSFPALRIRSTALRTALKLGTCRWTLRTSIRMSFHFHCCFSRKYHACAEAARERPEGCNVTVSEGIAAARLLIVAEV